MLDGEVRSVIASPISLIRLNIPLKFHERTTQKISKEQRWVQKFKYDRKDDVRVRLIQKRFICNIDDESQANDKSAWVRDKRYLIISDFRE